MAKMKRREFITLRRRGGRVAARSVGAAGGISASFELPSEREVVTDRAMEAWYNSSIA